MTTQKVEEIIKEIKSCNGSVSQQMGAESMRHNLLISFVNGIASAQQLNSVEAIKQAKLILECI